MSSIRRVARIRPCGPPSPAGEGFSFIETPAIIVTKGGITCGLCKTYGAGAAHLETGDIFVVGCSSSEIMGGRIGKDSSMEAAAAVLAGVLPPLQEQGVYLAAQCCEHLNRSIVIEREAAKANGYQIVSAIPQPHAGGSWATNCWQRFNDPVLVEEVRAAAGMDIGGTLIGMHLRRVAVPVRLSMDHIGQAILLCARTRPPFIGGSRAVYSQEEVR